MSAIRLLIVDDSELVRVGLKTLLSRFPSLEVVGEASNVAQAVAETERLAPDLVLLDIRLGDGMGFDACRQFQKLPVEPKVLILTSFANDDFVFEAIASGADGYLLKEIDGEGLVDAIQRVSSGQSVLDPAITGRVMKRVKQSGTPEAANRFDLLSPQERRVIVLVAQGKTNKEIGLELGLSDKTVKNYLSNVLDKLKFTRRSQVAAFVVQHSLK